MKRQRINQRKSRKLFSATAKNVHRMNGRGRPMRGGIRL